MDPDVEPLGRGVACVAFVVRACRESDLRALEWMGVFTPARGVIEDLWARHLGSQVRMLVADADGFPIGQVWVDLAGVPDRGVIWALRVLPGLRGAGIGSALLRGAERAIADAGLRLARLGVASDNIAALRLYLRSGYVPIGEQLVSVPGHADDGGPTLSLERHLLLEKRLPSGAPRAEPSAMGSLIGTTERAPARGVSGGRSRSRARTRRGSRAG